MGVRFGAFFASTEDETIMLKVLTSKNALKRLTKELPELEARNKEAQDTANNLLSAADGLKREKVILSEFEVTEKQVQAIIDTLFSSEHREVTNCFNIVQYGPYGARTTANINGQDGVKNRLLEEFMSNLQREKENLRRGIAHSENFLKEYPKIKKLLKYTEHK